MRGSFAAVLYTEFAGQCDIRCGHTFPLAGKKVLFDEFALADWEFGDHGRGRGYLCAVSYFRRSVVCGRGRLIFLEGSGDFLGS